MIQLTPIVQETEYNCGPAVIQTLLAYQGINISQSDCIAAAHIENWIQSHGMQTKHMQQAVTVLAPQQHILIKNNSNPRDLELLIKKYQLPVAVNWQGLFVENPEKEKMYPDLDNGHYSIVVDISVENDFIILVDPYPEFSSAPRTFKLAWFIDRWWDVGTEIDDETQQPKKFLTKHLSFVIGPQSTINTISEKLLQ